MKSTTPFTHLLLIVVIFTISGCGLPTALQSEKQVQYISLSQYYSWIKGLEPEQLASEITLQQNRKAKQHQDASLYLLLLHSLPSSTIHNPYTAKSMLNNGEFNQYIYSTVSSNDLAFVTMLRDQLNQQLLLLQAQQQNDNQASTQISKLKMQLTMHQQAMQSLEEKLNQLKSIERQLSERDNH